MSRYLQIDSSIRQLAWSDARSHQPFYILASGDTERLMKSRPDGERIVEPYVYSY